MAILRAVFALAMGAATLGTFLVSDVTTFQQPSLARIFLWHFPCAMISAVMVFAAPYLSLRYLATRDRGWDVRAAAASELAFLFAVLTMLTGMLFSRVQWGAWWQRDPRQESFAIVLLLLGAYFSLRASFADEARRAAIAAAYSLASALPVLFLVFVYPRLESVKASSFHPSTTIQEGLLSGEYRYSMLSVLALLFVVTIWLYRQRVRAGLLELASEEFYGSLETRGGDPAPSGVVRPVPLRPEDRPEGA